MMQIFRPSPSSSPAKLTDQNEIPVFAIFWRCLLVRSGPEPGARIVTHVLRPVTSRGMTAGHRRMGRG